MREILIVVVGFITVIAWELAVQLHQRRKEMKERNYWNKVKRDLWKKDSLW